MALIRLQQMVEHARSPSTKQSSWLKEIRNLMEIPQTQLAVSLSVQQAAVSRLESRNDIKLSSLISYMEGLGIQLEVKAHNDDFEMAIPLSQKLFP